MNCADFEILLCDHLDGVLPEARKAEFELHLKECAACAEMARDVQAATGFLEKVPAVEPPPELLTKIVFELPAAHQARARKPGGLRRFQEWLQPVMQPRFAMGFAMTILSFSLLARFTGISTKQLTPENLNPAKVWRAVDDKVYRTWQRTVKFYENIRLVYEIQAQLREWTQSDQEARNRAADQQKQQAAPPAAAPANPGQGTKQEPQPNSTGTPNAPLRNEKQEK